MLVTFDAKKPTKTPARTESRGPVASQFTVSTFEQSADTESDAVVHNLDADHPPDSRVFHFTKKKIKGGCITCKIRKKRCNEERPICSDCSRLGKNCVWATEDMSSETVRHLKKQVEEEENNSRKRKTHEKPPESKRPKAPYNFKEFISGRPPTVRVASQNKSDADQVKLRPVPVHHQQHHHNHQHHHQADHREGTADPLDTEVTFPGQTPVSANLMHFPTRVLYSPQLLPAEPTTASKNEPHPLKWIPQQKQPFSEFNNMFESNIRNFFAKSPRSDKITSLDDEEEDESAVSPISNIPPSPITQDLTVQNYDNTSRRSSAFNFDSILNDTSYFEFLDMNLPSPSPNLMNVHPQQLNFDPVGARLYDYYRNRLSGIVCIVPPESNFYRSVFLPIAMENPGMLYSILAFSAVHIGGEYEREASKYMDKALDYLKTTQVKTDGEAVERLSTLLIMTASEICKGDVRKWPVFLQWGAKMIRDRGGLEKFRGNRKQQWLISNFAYHDFLASSTGERGTHFPMEAYDDIVLFSSGVDPLQGIVKPLFTIIGEISTLANETKKLLKISSNSLGYGIMNDDEDEDTFSRVKSHEVPSCDTSPDSVNSDFSKKHTRYSSLLTIMQKASAIENKINNAKPNPEDLKELTDEELELQLTLFELFQLTAKLHVRQSVLRLNPSSLETQFILCELLKCLDVILKSPAESCLCFPLFIAGMNCTTKRDRKMMLERFQDLIDRYSFRNLERARTIMEQVWFIDPSGTRCVDWYEIVKRLGWDLSFA